MTADLLYTTVDLRLRLSLGGTSGDEFEAVLLQCCRVATRRVQAYCGQRFVQWSGSRRYNTVPPGVMALHIDPYINLTQIAVNTSGKDSDYSTIYTNPDLRTNFEKSRSGQFVIDWLDSDLLPYDEIIRADGQLWPIWVPFTDHARIKVSANWGWPVMPEDVSESAGLIAAQIYKLRDSPLGVAGIADMGLVTVRQMPYVRDLLQPYKSIRSIGV